MYYKQNGIYIQFNVDEGQITNWTWDDKPNEKYSCLEYNDFMFMIEQDIYKSDSIKKIVTSDIVDKYCNMSNTNTNNNKTEVITTTSTTEVNFDILFISAFVREKLADVDEYSTVVVLKSGVKLTFHDIDYEDFIAELDIYYRVKGDIFE